MLARGPIRPSLATLTAEEDFAKAEEMLGVGDEVTAGLRAMAALGGYGAAHDAAPAQQADLRDEAAVGGARAAELDGAVPVQGGELDVAFSWAAACCIGSPTRELAEFAF